LHFFDTYKAVKKKDDTHTTLFRIYIYIGPKYILIAGK